MVVFSLVSEIRLVSKGPTDGSIQFSVCNKISVKGSN